jgi:hypothetical protein
MKVHHSLEDLLAEIDYVHGARSMRYRAARLLYRALRAACLRLLRIGR